MIGTRFFKTLFFAVGDHVTVIFTHMEIDPNELSTMGFTDVANPSRRNPCSWVFLQVFEGENTDGPLLGTWCNNVTPPPVTSTGSSLTLHLFTQFEFFTGHFVATYSVLNTGMFRRGIAIFTESNVF